MAVSKGKNLPEKYCNAHGEINFNFLKPRTPLLLLAIYTAFSLLLSGCLWNSQKNMSEARPTVNIENPSDEEDFIAFSLAADKSLLAIHNVNTPNNLKQYNVKPVSIKSKRQLEDYLKHYWAYAFIDKKWREGSKKNNGQLFGFTVKDTGFLSASDVKFKKVSKTTVLVSGKVSDPTVENKFRIRIMSIEKTKNGWKATGIQYKELGVN